MSEGIVGSAEGTSNFDQVTASGNIRGYRFVGGFAGSDRTTVIYNNSSASGDVSSSSYYIGGFVGEMRGNATQCSASGNIAGGNDVGGFAGRMRDTSSAIQSFATGNVSATASNSYAGGFVGHIINNNVISDSYSQGSVNGVSSIGGFL